MTLLALAVIAMLRLLASEPLLLMHLAVVLLATVLLLPRPRLR